MIDISKPVMIEGRKDLSVQIIDSDFNGKLATFVTSESGRSFIKSFLVFEKSGEGVDNTMRLTNALKTTFSSIHAPFEDRPYGFQGFSVNTIEESKRCFCNESLYGRRIGFIKLIWDGDELVHHEFIKEGEQND